MSVAFSIRLWGSSRVSTRLFRAVISCQQTLLPADSLLDCRPGSLLGRFGPRSQSVPAAMLRHQSDGPYPRERAEALLAAMVDVPLRADLQLECGLRWLPALTSVGTLRASSKLTAERPTDFNSGQWVNVGPPKPRVSGCLG